MRLGLAYEYDLYVIIQAVRVRVRESSVTHRLFTNDEEESKGQENLTTWGFSGCGPLGDYEVWIEARRPPDLVIAIVQSIYIGRTQRAFDESC